MDASGFLERVQALRHGLMAYCRRLLWDPSILEDAVQETLMTAFRRRGEHDPDAPFAPWVFRIATLTVFNLNRGRRRDRTVELPADLPSDDPEAALELEWAYERLLSAPEAVVETLNDELRSALGALPDMERSVLLLRAVGGFSTRETAAILEIPLGSVMGYLWRARTSVRRRLAGAARPGRDASGTLEAPRAPESPGRELP